MRIVSSEKIRDAVSALCIKANVFLRPDVLSSLKASCRRETNKRAKKILEAIIKNAATAAREKLAICQDTGMPTVFLEIGQGLKIEGDLKKAVNEGVEAGYKKACLRDSVVNDPLLRAKPGYSPAVIHTDMIKGDRLKITVLPKGFGCENKVGLKMFKPTAKLDEIKEFIIGVVKTAGPDACPPYIVGVGIGGTADYAMLLAKKALLINLNAIRYALNAKFESDLLREINHLKVGPMGLGGKTTALGVNVLTYPTHIAGLPVAVNISCHALRSASAIL